MRDDGALYREPGIDVEAARLAIEPLGAASDQIEHGRSVPKRSDGRGLSRLESGAGPQCTQTGRLGSLTHCGFSAFLTRSTAAAESLSATFTIRRSQDALAMAYDRIYAGERFGFAKRVGRGQLPVLARELIQCWRAGSCPQAESR